MATSATMQSVLSSNLSTRLTSSPRVNQFLTNANVLRLPSNTCMRVRCKATEEQQTSPPQPPKFSTRFSDLLAFSGPAPERINGRLAMIGFVAAMAVEVSRGQDLFAQISDGGIPWFLGTSILLSFASLIPLSKGVSVESIETLSVDLEDKPSEKSKKLPNFLGPVTNNLSSRREHLGSESKEPEFRVKSNVMADRLQSNGKDTRPQNDAASPTYLGNPVKGRDDNALEEASESLLDAATDPTLPTEWVPPNLSVPILDLVDVIFQLQDGGWIRRKAFWVAKQILQLGMGDAFDDWLIEKIQLLRKGSVIALGIRRVEQILWPDGIFISKHPKRRPPPSTNQSQNSPHGQQPTVISSPKLTYEQQQEAVRRAKFVYELMIDNAPAAIVGLVGRKEYEQCAKDLYFFIQSSVCLKQLAFDLLELLLLSAFPELDYAFKQLQEEKHKFGEFKEN